VGDARGVAVAERAEELREEAARGGLAERPLARDAVEEVACK
jgi:hypothetical protein